MIRVLVFTIVVLGCVLADESAAESHVVKLNGDNFDVEIPKRHHFVMFYAPWCGHCSRLKPTWGELAEKLVKKDDDLSPVIAQVDCTVETELCSKQDVTGYPTLKLFKKGTPEGVRYRGQRDLASLEAFIAETLGTLRDEPVIVEGQVTKGPVELTEGNFHDHVSHGDHFIKFYAPWCGHCQRLAPTWEDLAASLEHDPSVTIAKVDCTQHRSICNDFEVKGYPTLLWITDGKKVDKYQGTRTHEDLKAFVDRMKKSQTMEEPVAEVEDGKVPPVLTSPVVQLVDSNFENGIATGISFVKFYAPWCGHCKRLAPTWEELSTKFIGSTTVKIAKVDCTEPSNRQLCANQKVNGFPTLLLYRYGEKIDEYDGNRSLEDMFSFVTRHIKHDEL